MDEKTQQLAFAICEFLQDSMKKMDADSKEGLEVAIQSIEEAFKIDLNNKSLSIKPNDLSKLFNVFIQTKQAVKPAVVKDTSKAEELKKEGNKMLGAKDFQGAIQKYTEAIEIDDTNAVYFANRAAAYSQAGQHDLAADDAKQALHVNPGYSKAYSRLGHAEFCLGNFDEAVDAYKKGLEKEPENANLKQSLAAAEAKLNESSVTRDAPRGMPTGMPSGMPDFASMMNDPNFMNMGIFI
jgi:small glutamine-rich tetratricopeptide repeat-containing protein alpha